MNEKTRKARTGERSQSRNGRQFRDIGREPNCDQRTERKTEKRARLYALVRGAGLAIWNGPESSFRVVIWSGYMLLRHPATVLFIRMSC
jgi:hypothetical protein